MDGYYKPDNMYRSDSFYDMTYQDEKCTAKWAKLVKRDGRCELCGETTNLQAHHPFGRKCHWFIKYNPDLGVALCGARIGKQGCHAEYDKDLSGLFAVLLPKLLHTQPERAALLQKTAKTYKVLRKDRIDYKLIWSYLLEFERKRGSDWYDEDIEVEYGRKF